MAKTFTKTKAKTKSSHAQRALADTRQLAESITEWTALVNAVFGPGGVLSRHVKTQSARVAFSKSKEFAAIWDMINQRQRAAAAAEPSGAFNLRLPKSIHAALSREAEREGVSLNQLCVAKLSATLAEVVS